MNSNLSDEGSKYLLTFGLYFSLLRVVKLTRDIRKIVVLYQPTTDLSP